MLKPHSRMTCVRHALQIRPQSLLAMRKLQQGPLFMRMRHLSPHPEYSGAFSTNECYSKWKDRSHDHKPSKRGLNSARSNESRHCVHWICNQISKTNCWTRLSMRFCTPSSETEGKAGDVLSMNKLPQMKLRRLKVKTPRAMRQGIAPQALRTAFDLY